MSKYGTHKYKGIPVYAGVPITGDVFYLGNASGGNDVPSHGDTPAKPFATWDYAVGKCTANNGDVIKVMAGHAENIALTTTVAHDVAGITVEGLGRGSNRPTFTQTATDAYVAITGANTVLRNLLFKAGVNTGTVGLLDIDAAGVLVEDCKFENVSNALHTDFLLQTDDTDNACDDLEIRNCEFDTGSGSTGDCHAAIYLVAVNDSVRISNCTFTGNYEDAAICGTDHILTNLHINNNYIENTYTGKEAIEFTGAATGFLIDNKFYTDTFANMLDPGSLKCSGNKGSIAVDTEGVAIPGVGSSEPRLAVHTTAAMSSDYDDADHPTVFTITGTVLARCWATCTTKVVSAGHTGTLELGCTDDLDIFMGTTTIGDGALDAGDVWTNATLTGDSGPMGDDGAYVVCNGTLIECDVNTNNMSAGVLVFYCQWIPLTAGAQVLAA